MIKFFRTIRYDLMKKDKTGKTALPSGRYFKYAFGEIILVVIGILIAIQLNEWRNDIFNAKQKQKVLLALKADFEANLTSLDTVFYNHQKSSEIFIETKNLIDSINYITDNTVFNTILTHGGYGYSYNPINGALRSAVSSGDIHLIENERLLELLFSWEDLVIDSYENIEDLRSYATDPYLKLIDEYVQVRELNKNVLNDNGGGHPSNFVGLFKDPLFENYMLRLFFKSARYRQKLKGIRKNNLEILGLIDGELK